MCSSTHLREKNECNRLCMIQYQAKVYIAIIIFTSCHKMKAGIVLPLLVMHVFCINIMAIIQQLIKVLYSDFSWVFERIHLEYGNGWASCLGFMDTGGCHRQRLKTKFTNPTVYLSRIPQYIIQNRDMHFYFLNGAYINVTSQWVWWHLKSPT